MAFRASKSRECRVKLTGGQVIAKALRAYGVRYVAGVPGNGNSGVLEGLNTPGASIPFIRVVNEQSAIHMADGYFRACGSAMAVVLPAKTGIFTASAALSNCLSDSCGCSSSLETGLAMTRPPARPAPRGLAHDGTQIQHVAASNGPGRCARSRSSLKQFIKLLLACWGRDRGRSISRFLSKFRSTQTTCALSLFRTDSCREGCEGIPRSVSGRPVCLPAQSVLSFLRVAESWLRTLRPNLRNWLKPSRRLC